MKGIEILIHDRISPEKTLEICRKHGVFGEDDELVKRIISEWDKLFGNFPEKMRILREISKESPNFLRIQNAMIEINEAFVFKKRP